MKNLIYLFLLSTALILGSCNKENATKVIDGNWEISSMVVTQDGVTEEFIEKGTSARMIFYNCKLKKNRNNEGALMIEKDGQNGLFRYDFKVQENEKTLDIINDEDKSVIGYWTINEFDGSHLNITEHFFDSNVYSTWVLTK